MVGKEVKSRKRKINSTEEPVKKIAKINEKDIQDNKEKQKKAKQQLKLGEFFILPVEITDNFGTRVRNIYYKKYDKLENTLFAINFPPRTDVEKIIVLFGVFGDIKSIKADTYNKKPVNVNVKDTEIKKKTIENLDLNLNLNVGKTYDHDIELKYRRINDIKALKLKDFRHRRGLPEQKTENKEEKLDEQMEDAEEEGIDLSQIQFIGGDYVKIIFEEEKAVSKALSLTQFQINKLKFTLDLRNAENATLPPFMKKYEQIYKDPKQLERETNEFIKDFDNKRQQEAREKAEKAKTPDEDGWVTVVSKSKKKAKAGGVQVAGVKSTDVILKPSKNPKVLQNFYKFQKLEKRKELLDNLRKQFEEDKKRIEKMRSSRNFRPY